MPSFETLSKIEPDYSDKKILKLKLLKNHFYKKCVPKLFFFNGKKIREIRIIFDIENSLESPILHFAKLGKASWDAYNQGGWLISSGLSKIWIAKCVPYEVNDNT